MPSYRIYVTIKCSNLSYDIRTVLIESNLVYRLQKAEEQWQLELTETGKKHSETTAALEKERGELQQRLSEAESSLAQTCSQLASLEAEMEGLRNRAKALEEAVGKLQSEANQARAQIKERETEEKRLCLSLEQLETDLRSSKTLTETLQAELAEKQKREVELLGEKEQAVTQVFTLNIVFVHPLEVLLNCTVWGFLCFNI